MDCTKLNEQLAGYLGNELNGNERAAVEAHLESCASCRAEVEALQATVGELAQLTTVSAAEAAASTAGLEVRRRPSWWSRTLSGAMRYAAVLVIGVLIGHYLINGRAQNQLAQPAPAVEGQPDSEAWDVHPEWLAAARDLAYSAPQTSSLAGQLTLLRQSTRQTP